MAVAVCNGYFYAIGVWINNRAKSSLDTIERIQVAQLLNDHQIENAASWITLSACCLSQPRCQCAAVTVHDRFIVVAGGVKFHANGDSSYVLPVDIIDTRTPALTNDDEHHTVVTVSPGPSLQPHICDLRATVIDNQIWVVGGPDHQSLPPTQSLQFGSLQTNNDSSESIFSSTWNLRPDISLRQARYRHAVAAMGQCLVVAAGREILRTSHRTSTSVELLDPHRGVILPLPDLTQGLCHSTVVEIPHQGLVVIGRGVTDVRIESLACVNLSLGQFKNYLKELELRQSCDISCSVSHASKHRQQQTALEVQLHRSKVESLCLSLVFFYLFHRAGHVPLVQQQPELQHKKRK